MISIGGIIQFDIRDAWYDLNMHITFCMFVRILLLTDNQKLSKLVKIMCCHY